jgi:hypothetical protein
VRRSVQSSGINFGRNAGKHGRPQCQTGSPMNYILLMPRAIAVWFMSWTLAMAGTDRRQFFSPYSILQFRMILSFPHSIKPTISMLECVLPYAKIARWGALDSPGTHHSGHAHFTYTPPTSCRKRHCPQRRIKVRVVHLRFLAPHLRFLAPCLRFLVPRPKWTP